MKSYLLFSLVLSGCSLGSWDEPRPTPPPAPPPPPSEAPALSVSVPPWPPLGANAAITVNTSHPRGLSELSVAFLQTRRTPLTGTSQQILLRGRDLGEGYGRLEIAVDSVDNRTSTAFVSNLLVDLTPPEIDSAGPILLRPGASFRVTAGDAWILGKLTVDIGTTQTGKIFEAGFPESFGQEWDIAEVEVPITTAHPAGPHTAYVHVTDAAGNTTEAEVAITIDATPPAIAFISPTANATVADHLDVELEASDPEGPVWIDLAVSGTHIATLTGDEPTLSIDLAEFPRGHLDLQARARDAAGNESEPATLTVERR